MLNLNRSSRSQRSIDRRRLMMMAGSAVLSPWLSACGGGAGNETLANTPDTHSGLEFPTVAGSPRGTADNTKHALSWSSETEAVLHSAQLPSWAYYTDLTEVRWYITHVGMFKQADDILSLGHMVDGEAAWWTVGKDVATGATSSRTLTAALRLDSDTSTTFWDAGRRVLVTDSLILDDRRRIQGATVPLKWWFFQAPNGNWYILLDPAYDGGSAPVVHRFASKDNQYHWPKLSLPGTRTIFEWEGTQPRARFTPVPGYADATVGKAIDRDGYYGAQCVDLMHDYLDVALGVPFRSTKMAGNAYAIFQNASSSATYDSRKYDKVTFKKTIRGGSNTVPLPGDIVFWARPDPGHVAIVVDADASNITTIDQNWVGFDADRGSSAARVTHPNNSDVAGWLRPTW